MPKVRVLWNAKDFPCLPSGYGTMGKHLLPRLAKHYGPDNILIFAPVYQRDEVREWQGMKVLPGTGTDFDEATCLEHYRRNDCTMLLQVGDWAQLRKIPQAAAEDQIVWVQWGAFDLFYTPEPVWELLKYPTKFVSFSKYGEERVLQKGLENVAPAIWIGLDMDIWQPRERSELPQAMHSLGFTESTFNILIVQANQRRKYIRETIEGIARFRQTNPTVPIRVYIHSHVQGDSNLEIDVFEAGLSDVVKFPDDYQMAMGGFSEEQLAAAFNCSDVVMDLAYEGFGMSITQAQAVGLPVIALAEGTGPELVRHGVLVPAAWTDYTIPFHRPVASPDAIAIALAEVATAPRGRSQEAIQWARENLSWDIIAKQWIQVIDEVHELRDRYTLYIPEPSQTLKLRARQYVEVNP